MGSQQPDDGDEELGLIDNEELSCDFFVATDDGAGTDSEIVENDVLQSIGYIDKKFSAN